MRLGRLLILINLFLCFSGICYAAPSTKSINGYFSNNGSVVWAGSGAGVKSIASPFKWDNFESGNIDGVYDTPTEGTFDIVTSPIRSNSTFTVRSNSNPTDSRGSQIGVSSSNTYDGYYTSFWQRYENGYSFDTNGQDKHIRIFTGSEGFPYPNVGVGKFGFENQRQFSWSIENGAAGNYVGYGNLYDDYDWHRIDMWFKPSTGIGNSDGIVKVWIDCVSIVNLSNVTTDSGGYNSYSGLWGVSTYYYQANNDSYIDDVYFDYTQARVEIGNNPIFANCTHREIQIPTSWLDTSITITFNQGSFVDGEQAYLFIIDSDGNASDGYPITIGETTPTISSISCLSGSYN